MDSWDPYKNGGYIRNPDDVLTLDDLIARNPEAFARDPQGYLKQQGGYVMPKFVPLEEERKAAKQRSCSIFANFEILQGILDRHEETIRKRWEKKSQEGRKKVLQAAWPGISQEHHPEWKAMTATAEVRGLSGPILPPDPKFRDAFLLPNLNVEDLTGRKSLLVLLNSRGRNTPGTFAFSDYQSAYLGIRARGITPNRVKEDGEYYMRIIGQCSANTYGSIYSMPKNLPRSKTNAGDVRVDVGQIILEIQDRTLHFLIQCAKAILHDITPDKVLGEQYPVHEPLAPLTLDNNSETITVASLAEEGPYHVPRAMDFDVLLNLVEAKRGESEDHMWALREDPGYFLETAISGGEHRQESVLDKNGNQHPFKGTRIFWDRILTNMVAEAYNYLMSWTIVRDQIQRIANLHKQHAHLISNDKLLPADLELELRAYKYFIELMISTSLLLLVAAVPGSPELRSYWIRDIDYPDPNVCYCTTRSPVLHDYLLMLFTIVQDNDRRELMGLQNIMDEIERQTRRDPKDKQRISPMVAKVFSELALIGELERQLKLYQPRLYEPFQTLNSAVGKGAVMKRTIELSGRMMSVADHMDEMKLSDVGKLDGNRFNYPAETRRTKETVEQMRIAETNLDKFWHRVDQVVLTRAKRNDGPRKTLHILFPTMIESLRVLQRTDPWVDHLQAPRLTPAKQGSMSVKETQLELELRTQSTIDGDEKPTTPKTRTKTRGVATEHHEPQREVPQVLTETPRFIVNKRAYKVFNALFHDPLSPDRPGEVAWLDFLYAMATVRFMFEKLYGSVWKFTPIELPSMRPINIHEPHPDRKIPHATARRHGRRLNRAYGWSAETFVLE